MIDIEEYRPLVINLALKVDKTKVKDLIPVGIIALIKCAEEFDETKGIKFSTFAYKKIKGAMKNEIIDKSWFKRVKNNLTMISINEVEDYLIEDNLEDIIIDREKSGILQNIIDTLDENEKEIIKMVYWNGMSIVEVAYSLGLKRSRVCQMHKDILDKIKVKLNDKQD